MPNPVAFACFAIGRYVVPVHAILKSGAAVFTRFFPPHGFFFVNAGFAFVGNIGPVDVVLKFRSAAPATGRQPFGSFAGFF